ncbi:MAG TPA: hypothetical protein VHX42_05035 [Candidatus Babeliales bacterium]|jgi:hypothetical protein|nr:hypothetical protein [Candidatus Babeliales bacterium]
MKKWYTKYAMIGLLIICSSLSGMEKKPDYTVTVQPVGGRITSSNTIHYAVVECRNRNNELDQKAHQKFQYRKLIPTFPTEFFTQKKQPCNIIINDHNVHFVSDRVYEEKSFSSNDEYWHKI